MRQANAARRVCMKLPKVDCSKIVDFFSLIICIEGFGGRGLSAVVIVMVTAQTH